MMTSTILPFLYQTRTLLRGCRLPLAFTTTQRAYATRRQHRGQPGVKVDRSIPFELDEEDQALTGGGGRMPGENSTITHSEAEIFKGIFEEIAEGRMPKARKRPAPEDATKDAFESLKKSDGQVAKAEGPKSIVDQVRITEFRDKFLRKYPVSLRKAAETALGKFEFEPHRDIFQGMTELDEEEARKVKEWQRCKAEQEKEKERVIALMRDCENDADLWDVMEEEVFSLPKKLGILQETKSASKRGRKAKAATSDPTWTDAESEMATDSEKRMMDIHGPLYPHYITIGLELFDSSFPRPSPLAFKILPRVKELGLPSYVLGVTTPFYSKLAQMHWNHFGDAASTFDMLEEMRSLGLEPNDDVATLLNQIRDHLHGCTWGAQGPFVMAIMESAPFDTALMQRLEAAEDYVQQSFEMQGRM